MNLSDRLDAMNVKNMLEMMNNKTFKLVDKELKLDEIIEPDFVGSHEHFDCMICLDSFVTGQ